MEKQQHKYIVHISLKGQMLAQYGTTAPHPAQAALEASISAADLACGDYTEGLCVQVFHGTKADALPAYTLIDGEHKPSRPFPEHAAA